MSSITDTHRIDRLTAEFADPETEADFRVHSRTTRVRDTRLTIGLAGLLYMTMGYADYLTLGGVDGLGWPLASRLLVCLVGLLGALAVSRYSEWLMNGVIPTVVVSVAMFDFMLVSLWVPYDFGTRGMGMMVMLYGIYVFIPNRFLPALGVAMAGTLVYLVLSLSHYRVGLDQYATQAGHLLVTNLMGAMIAYRLSRMMREEYRNQAIVRQYNQRLEVEMAERQRLESILRRRAELDDITGIANRAVFFELATRRLAAAEAAQTPMALLLVDVDYFKQLNGTYGHMRCDEVLRAVVRICQESMDPSSCLARLGGEEFVLMPANVDFACAVALAERIRSQCQRTPVAMAEIFVHFTVSIGVVQQRPGDTINVLLRRADEATSAAKYKGRNRVEAAP